MANKLEAELILVSEQMAWSLATYICSHKLPEKREKLERILGKRWDAINNKWELIKYCDECHVAYRPGKENCYCGTSNIENIIKGETK